LAGLGGEGAGLGGEGAATLCIFYETLEIKGYAI